ncbi:E3 ubiquitin-protein ligase PDZRN3-B [Rhipicephalus sanguineus]|uniref:RING-type domain-containing protein n=1 Tax=Rhipicephalus sanguineus TaxID=34632 RepID=A0A9D4T7Q3_RHISA|nr:E3 ubiquitin-protein ligase PDZRN3-B [Rhipicephalus sanguineus]KAH7976584.1 hypothetical protein HPB52_016819 [Rhipicephalus sanguineus]
MTDGWEYTLTGFSEFLEMRRVAFAEPMPATRLCGVCGLLPSRTSQLPCGHVFCESCKAQLPQGKDRCCPFEGKKFADSEVHSMSIELRELEQRRIVCAAGSRVCGFSGKLSELADHLARCGSGETKCGKCQRPVFRNLAVDHYRRCTGPLCAANSEADAKGMGDAAKMADVERSTRQLMLSKGVDLEAVFSCFTNALAEKVASLERQLLEVQKKSNDKQSSVAAETKAAVIHGPYRAVSRAGVLITTCKFADICAGLDSLNEKKNELAKSTDTYSLGGYTFKLNCKFSKDENDMNVAFILHLRDGEWDSYVEWPFKKKVTLIIMHPRNEAKDIRLLVDMDDHDLVKKPSAGTWNWGRWTKKKNWKDIELQGYVDRNALYVNIEFEQADAYRY